MKCKKSHKPNKATKQAIYEARNNINLTEIKDLEAYKKEFLKELSIESQQIHKDS